MGQYQEPADAFDPVAAYGARAREANQYYDRLVMQHRQIYEHFWQLPRTHPGRALSLDEMQQTLDQHQTDVQAMLSASARMVQFISDEYPEALAIQEGEDEPKFPTRYHTAPYEYHTDANGRLVLDSLKSEWEAQ